MSDKEKYTREQRIKDLNEYLTVIPMSSSTRYALIKQIAMVRTNDMEIANGADGILKLQLDIMYGASEGRIS
jgi:hypothetical protein